MLDAAYFSKSAYGYKLDKMDGHFNPVALGKI